MARIKIGDWLIEDAVLTMSGGRLCLRWAADAWDGTLDSAAELLGVADELRELDADDMTVALYAVRGLASLRMDAEHAAMEAVLCVDPMEVGAAEKLGQQIMQQGRELGAAIEAQSTALGERIDGQEALLGAARHHRPGVSGGYHHRLCRGNESQHRRRLRNAVAAYRGREGADSVGRKPSRGMGGRRSDAQTYSGRDAGAYTLQLYVERQLCRDRYARILVYLQRWCDRGICYIRLYCRSGRQYGPQQHAAVAGCMPLEARGLSYAVRKGAAV